MSLLFGYGEMIDVPEIYSRMSHIEISPLPGIMAGEKW